MLLPAGMQRRIRAPNQFCMQVFGADPFRAPAWCVTAVNRAMPDILRPEVLDRPLPEAFGIVESPKRMSEHAGMRERSKPRPKDRCRRGLGGAPDMDGRNSGAGAEDVAARAAVVAAAHKLLKEAGPQRAKSTFAFDQG